MKKLLRLENDISEAAMYTPCRGCDNRSVGCHSKCCEYYKYRQELDMIQENKKKFEAVYDYMCRVTIDKTMMKQIRSAR